MAVDILIIRNSCDQPTELSNWLGEGLKDYLVEKGYSVKDLSGADASRQNVENWLNISESKTKKLVIGFDHGDNNHFYGENNGQLSSVIDLLNVERLVKRIHVYTFACFTNIDQGLGQLAIKSKCYSWLGYTGEAWGIRDENFKQCIWSYIDAVTDGKSIDVAEKILRDAYQRNIKRHPSFEHNLKLLLLRKLENKNNMTINMGRCELITDPRNIEAGRNYVIKPLVAADLNKVLTVQDPRNGSYIIQSNWRNGDEQKWKIYLGVDDEYYSIMSVRDQNRGLDVEKNSKDDGALILSYDYRGDDNQHWRIIHPENTRAGVFMIESLHSGKVLDVPHSSIDDEKIIQYTWNRTANQQWLIYQLD